MLTVSKGRSPRTITAYETDLRHAVEGLGDLTQVDRVQIDSYVAAMRDSGAKASTVARHVSSLKGFYRYCLDEGYMSTDPTALLSPSQRGKSLPKALGEERINQLLESIDTGTVLGLRDVALIEFLYGTGARVSEMTNVDLADVDFDEGLIKVLGKGDKQRLVPMGRHLDHALRHYLAPGARQSLLRNASSVLFVNARGGALTRHGVNEILRRRCTEAGLATEGIHAHAFRHSCATHMIAHGADIRVVQELLGHASIATTQRYTSIAITTLRAAYEDAHPRATP